MTTVSYSLPRACAQIGSAIARLPYGKNGPGQEFQTPGRFPMPARRGHVRHHQRVDELRAVRALDPDRDLRPEIQPLDGLGARGGAGGAIAVGLEA